MLDRVFSDFRYVGDFPANDLALEGRAHESAPLPRSVQPGVHYVYHLDDDRDFEEMATILLPGRLLEIGAADIDAPKSVGDMAIPNMGNPIWQIDFTIGPARGMIWNRFEMQRRSQFADSSKLLRNEPDPRIDDYVVRFR